jgi:hypothetical protein
MRPYLSALLLALAPSAFLVAAGPKYMDWETPARLTSIEAPGYLTVSPYLSKDGSRLYFGSNRPGGAGANDMWVAGWNDQVGDWNPPVNLGAVINSEATTGTLPSRATNTGCSS